jgi:hypothetical protein
MISEGDMILNVGEKVHIIERRLFREDAKRHFIGEVIGCTENSFRVTGYDWTIEAMRGFVRKPEKRERIMVFNEGYIINIIPDEVNIEDIHYIVTAQQYHVVTDGKNFSLDITEFTIN